MKFRFYALLFAAFWCLEPLRDQVWGCCHDTRMPVWLAVVFAFVGVTLGHYAAGRAREWVR